MESYLLPGVVAVVVSLSVLYLLYNLLAGPSKPQPPAGNKRKRAPGSKKVTATKKTPSERKKSTKPAEKKQKPNQKNEPSSAEEDASPPSSKRTTSNDKGSQPPKKGSSKATPKKKRVERVPSAENLNDFHTIDITKEKDDKNEATAAKKVSGEERINAAKEDPLAEGWEIVGLRKKEWKQTKRKEREVELEKERKEQAEKAAKEGDPKDKKERKGGRDRREGARDNRPPREPRGPKGFSRNKKEEDKSAAEKVLPVVSEKTRRREEITINGILFSKFKDEEEESEDWDLLSETIENGSSSSDDIAPLRTAHLEMRYYSTPKEAGAPSPKKKISVSAETPKGQDEAWASAPGELAKYNYTQGPKKEDQKEKDEGPSEPHAPLRMWEARNEASGLIDDKTAELVEAFIKALGHPFTSNLAKVELSAKGKPQRYLIRAEVDTLRARLLKLLSSGVSLEPPVCGSQSEAAEFVERLLSSLETPFVCFTNEQHASDGSASKGAKFWRKGFGDEGFFIISGSKIIMIWFIGHD